MAEESSGVTMFQGNKTYIIAACIAIVAAAHYLGYVDDTLYGTLVGLLTGGGIASLGAKGNRIEAKTDALQNKM